MIIYLFSLIVAIGLGGLAGWFDFRGMTIPNRIVAGVTITFFIAFGAAYGAGVDIFNGLASHLLTGVSILAVTFAMFAARLIGGGDSKLIAAFSFWTGQQGLAVFLFIMMIAGVVLGIFALFVKKVKPFKAPAEGSWIQRIQAGEGLIPYGIPIAVGAFCAFYDMGLLAPGTLKLFLMPN